MAVLNLQPGTVNLAFLGGGTYTTTIQLFQDAAQTMAFDLTGYTPALVIGTALTLTVGSGLAVPTPANGTIVATLTAAQTQALVASAGVTQYPYFLRLTDGSGNVSYPLVGTVSITPP